MSELINIDAQVNGYIHRGVSAVKLDEESHLIITLTDGTVKNLGCVKGEQGQSGLLPVYTLPWCEALLQDSTSEKTEGETEDDGADAEEVAEQIKALLYTASAKAVGEYRLMLQVSDALLECMGVQNDEGVSFGALFTDGHSLYSYVLDMVNDTLQASETLLVSIDSEVIL